MNELVAEPIPCAGCYRFGINLSQMTSLNLLLSEKDIENMNEDLVMISPSCIVSMQAGFAHGKNSTNQ